jgi:hypothetical protein
MYSQMHAHDHNRMEAFSKEPIEIVIMMKSNVKIRNKKNNSFGQSSQRGPSLSQRKLINLPSLLPSSLF